MNCIVHLLTAVAIFVHATTGCCCAHAEHEYEAGDEHSELSVTGCGHRSHVGGIGHPADLDLASQAGSEDGEHSSPPAPHECRNSKCIWPAPKVRDGVDVRLFSFAIELQLIVEMLETQFLNEKNTLDTSTEYSWLALPVRTHLAKCVFLI